MTADLDIARDLAAHGVPIFLASPALADGRWDPAGGHNGTGYWLPKGWDTTRPDPATLDRYRPGDAVCAVMGHALDLLDVDPRNGGDGSRSALLAAGMWPTVYGHAATPSGGTHEFVASLGVASHDGLQAGLDVKAGLPDGSGRGRGFAFLAPTRKLSKVTGEVVAYRWLTEPMLDELDPADDSGHGIAEMIRASRTGTSATTEPGEARDWMVATPIPRGKRYPWLLRYAGWMREKNIRLAEARVLHRRRWEDCEQPADYQMPWADAERQLEDIYTRYQPGGSLTELIGAPVATPTATQDADAAAEPAAPTASPIRERFPIINWHELFADDAEEEWILEPLLPARRLVAVYSAPKVGKSLLMLEIAAGVSRGAETLGTTPDRAFRVLYVDFENDPKSDIRPRLQDMGYDPERLGNLCYLSFPNLAALDCEQGSLELLAAATEYACEVIVIDTVSRAVDGDENENDTWLNFYRHTGLKLKKAGLAMIRLDHTGKDPAKGQRGGSAKSGDVDAVWRLSAISDDTLRLECEANRMPVAEKNLVLKRLTTPKLRHKVEGDGRRAAFEAKVNEIVDLADRLGLPATASRTEIRALMTANGIRARNETVAAVCKKRTFKPVDNLSPRLGDRLDQLLVPEAVGTTPDESAGRSTETPGNAGLQPVPKITGTGGDRGAREPVPVVPLPKRGTGGPSPQISENHSQQAGRNEHPDCLACSRRHMWPGNEPPCPAHESVSA